LTHHVRKIKRLLEEIGDRLDAKQSIILDCLDSQFGEIGGRRKFHAARRHGDSLATLSRTIAEKSARLQRSSAESILRTILAGSWRALAQPLFPGVEDAVDLAYQIEEAVTEIAGCGAASQKPEVVAYQRPIYPRVFFLISMFSLRIF
jgi:hypothetical protein